MKKYILIITLVIPTLLASPLKKDIIIHFNPAKLTSEMKGDATLFKYDDKNCKYVVHEHGSPVLPCLPVYVLMPKGAIFKSCSVRVEAQPLCGKFKLYCRRFVAEAAFTAKRYPPKLAEFAGYKNIDGYRTFEFRTYPVTCQPGDNSVNKILKTSLAIKYEVPEGEGLYARFSSNIPDGIKRKVVNPNDLDELTADYYVETPLKKNVAQNSFNYEFFDTKKEKKDAVNKPDVAVKQKQSAIDDIVDDKLFVDDNDIVYAPITF